MNGPFFQFPLCALSFPASEWDRLDQVISFCCLEVGKRRWEKFNQIEKKLRRQDLLGMISCICEMDLTNETHHHLVAGAQLLEVKIGNIRRVVASHERLAHFVREFERKHGTDTQVRLAQKFVFEARDNKGMSYQELSVLAGIYSKIGATKGPVRITREEIWRRALGFKSKRVFSVEMRDRQAWITPRQVRSIIERLHERRFFARLTFARRQTFYSHRLSAKQLADDICVQKVQRDLVRRARIRANDALTKRIQAARQRIAARDAAEGAADAAT
jgi:hypothetical protein